MVSTNGAPRAIQLGVELRQARKRAGFTVTQMAERMNHNHSHISRWETAKLTPSVEDTATFLAILDVVGEERDQLLELARDANEPDWVAPGIGKQLAALIEYERSASRITEVAPLLIPGLLQTREYAISIMMGAGDTRGKAEQGALLRVGRQDVLNRRRPPHFTALISEYVLRYPACDDATMVEQLYHLLDMADRPNVVIRIIPLSVRYTRAREGSFLVFEFDSRMKPVVQIDSYWSSSALTNARAVGNYLDTADKIRADTIGVDESKILIRRILTEMESRA